MKVKVKVRRSGAPEPENVKIGTEYIKLDSFLKFANAAQTGGEAKMMVESGDIKVNGQVCFQRGKKLRDGDTVEISGGAVYKVSGGEDVH